MGTVSFIFTNVSIRSQFHWFAEYMARHRLLLLYSVTTLGYQWFIQSLKKKTVLIPQFGFRIGPRRLSNSFLRYYLGASYFLWLRTKALQFEQKLSFFIFFFILVVWKIIKFRVEVVDAFNLKWCNLYYNLSKNIKYIFHF